MNSKVVLAGGMFAMAGMALLMFTLPRSDALEPGRSGSVGSVIDALPASGAGWPSSPPQTAPKAPPPEGYLGGAKATGRVAQVYVKVAENVFLAVNQAPEHLQRNAERWVDIEFPDLLANDVGSARAVLNQSEAGVQVGDVVEIQFAHKDNPRFFPVKELTRVTEFVARRDEMLAKDFARRILARNGHGASPPDWLAHAPAAPSSPSPAPRTATAEARR